MKTDLSAEVVSARLAKLRRLCEEAAFTVRMARRLRRLRALYDLALFMKRARPAVAAAEAAAQKTSSSIASPGSLGST